MRRIVIALAALEILLVVGLASGELAMIPAVRNPVVEPAEGNWNDTYDYSVELRFNDAISIELWVWDPVMSDYCPQGTAEYRDIGNWTRIYWHVSPFSGSADYAGHDSKFKFRWNGTDLKERADGILRPLIGEGPSIKAIFTPTPSPTVQIFKNATVKPAYGHYNDSFTYSVFAQLNQTRNITLEIFDISSYEWQPVWAEYYSDKGNWQLLSWANVTNVSAVDSAGVASYRFFFFIDAGERRESVVFYGPELGLYPTPAPAPTVIYSGGGGGGGGISWRKLLEVEKRQKELAKNLSSFITAEEEEEVIMPQLVDPDVTPDNGSWNKSYNYSVVVVHPNRAERWLTLEVYCPGKGVTRIISNQKISNYNEKYLFNWNVSGNDSKEELKRALRDNFRIDWVEDANISTSNDNMTIHIIKDEQSAEIIMDGKKEKATLKISDDQTYELKVKTENGKLKIYYVNAVVEWREVNVFSKEDARANESPRFYIYFTEGYNNVILEKSDPKLNYPPLLSHPMVSPGNGTVEDSFEYEVNVRDRDGNNVTVTLHIVDPEGIDVYNETKEVDGEEAVNGKNVSWKYNKFTEEDDAGKTFMYIFSANDTIDVEEVKREGPIITDGIDEAEKDGGGGPSIKQGILGGLSEGCFVLIPLIILAVGVAIILFHVRLKNTEKKLLKKIEGVKETAEPSEKGKEIKFGGRIIEEEISFE